MTTELERRLQQVLDEIEQTPDAELAAEVESYRKRLAGDEMRGATLGDIALDVANSQDAVSTVLIKTEWDGSTLASTTDYIRQLLNGVEDVRKWVNTSIRVGFEVTLDFLQTELEPGQAIEPVTRYQERIQLPGEGIESNVCEQQEFEDMVA